MCNNMIVRKITDEINSLSVYNMHAIENVPSRLPIMFESRIEQIGPITLKGCRCSFSNFYEQILLDVTK